MGFGRSDKPIDGAIPGHHALLPGLGGLIGFRIVGDEPDLFACVIAANTTLPVMAEGANPYRLPADVVADPRTTNLAAVLGPQMAAVVVKFIAGNPLPTGGI